VRLFLGKAHACGAANSVVPWGNWGRAVAGRWAVGGLGVGRPPSRQGRVQCLQPRPIWAWGWEGAVVGRMEML